MACDSSNSFEIWCVPGLGALLTLAMVLGSGLPLASAQGFSAEERRALTQGELVVREEMRQRGELRLIGGTSYQVIDAPPEMVWRAVSDIPRYTRFIPQVVESRSVSRRGPRHNVYIRHEQGPVSASYHVNLTLAEDQRTAEFRVDSTRPRDIREGWGFFTVRPFGESKCIVTFAVLADVGSGLISGLVRPRVHEWMMRVPAQLKAYVEGSGRSRYR
ncbi:MAG: SRPBCC family protein [Myxococcota bacterium]